MLLGLDLGTTNVKALVTDLTGRPLGEGSCAVSLFYVGTDGVEQDIEEIWQAVLSAIKQAMASVSPADIRAIGVSSQGGALQMLDAQARPLGRVVSWLDRRGRPFDDALTAELGPQWFAERIGHARSGLVIGQLLRLRAEFPALLEPPNRIGFVGDAIVKRLCGEAGHDGTSCGIACLYNSALRDYDKDVLKRLGLTAEQFPQLLPARQPRGGLRPAVAQETGLRAGAPVSAAIHDQYAAALANGGVRSGTALIGTGTAWVLLAVSDSPMKPVSDSAFVCHHVVDGLWGQIISMPNGGSALAEALDLAGLGLQDSAELDRLLKSVPPGSGGLECWTVQAGFGASDPTAQASACRKSVQGTQSPASRVRATLEGLAYELKLHIDLLLQAGLPVEQLLLSGRSAASRVTAQILADVTGLPLACADNCGSPLGAAILARALLEPASSLADLSKEMAPAVHQVEAGAAAAFYREQYKRYVQASPRL
jgi:xylulokinase